MTTDVASRAATTERGTRDEDRLAIDTIRFLAVDMVEAAASGHPGAPLGQAPLAYLLWTRFLRHDPDDPDWPNRDRFVLSCGHASALLYALLHLAGYGLPVEELKRFRQLGSKTPGHPERELTRGVETTTGPLGQGVGNSVGMAIAEQLLGARFNRDGFPVIDYRTWVFASDGDMMEGVASEACSLAGHLRLSKLTVFYDDNEVSIDGPTALAFSEDVGARFAAYGWHVQRVEDGNDLAALEAAIRGAEAETERPSLVVVRTVIGYGSPKKAGTADVHGSPLGEEEAEATKRALGWPLEPLFHVPDEARAPFERARQRGRQAHAEWELLVARYAAAHPEEGRELRERLAGELPAGWQEALPSFAPDEKGMATRAASGKVLEALAPVLPHLVGGSADLTPSNNTRVKGWSDFAASERGGRYLRFGVREHAMGSILNGLALARAFVPYGGTFLIFSDYMRPPIRLAALMGVRAVYVFTHDSIFLGEDGPTHQPVEQLAALRAVPRLAVIRPADANETAQAWRMAIERRHAPTALALTRQNLPVLAETGERAAEGVPRGAYVLADPPEGEPEALLLATGSEVSVALGAHRRLAEEGVRTRVVSMPSWELFEEQDEAYRESVLPKGVRKRLAVEAAAPSGWHRWVGEEGEIHAIDRFGASSPYKDLAKAFGFTPEAVAERVKKMLGL
ncbi:MAG TPA: transketolase [Thermoanaerobaculia bacterium]|nr:transketolase [Thermoanaerobaculia bacterium]